MTSQPDQPAETVPHTGAVPVTRVPLRRFEPVAEAAAMLNDLERQHATDKAAMALLDDAMRVLSYLARTDHLRQFPHLKPSEAEQAALDLVARYERLGRP